MNDNKVNFFFLGLFYFFGLHLNKNVGNWVLINYS